MNIVDINVYKELKDDKKNRLFNSAKCEYERCEKEIEKYERTIKSYNKTLRNLRCKNIYGRYQLPISFVSTLIAIGITIYLVGICVYEKINTLTINASTAIATIMFLIISLILFGITLSDDLRNKNINELELKVKRTYECISYCRDVQADILRKYYKEGTCPKCGDKARINVLGEATCISCGHKFNP